MGYSFLLKVDDDRMLYNQQTVDIFKNKDPRELIYAGENMWTKKADERQLGHDGTFVGYFPGPSYALSWQLASQIVRTHREHSEEYLRYGSSSEDVDMGRWVQFEEQSGGKVNYLDVNISAGLADFVPRE